MDTYSLSYGIECEEDNSGNQGTKKFIIEYLGDEKYNNILPELTLDEFNDKVQRGLIKFHLKHYNFNNNNSKLSMHLIYANKSVDDSIVNLKDCYYHSLNNNNTNDNTNIDDVLSITYIFDKLPDNFSASITGEGEEELQRIRKSGLEGKIDKDILESWFKGGEETSSSTSSIPSPSPAAAVKASSS
ncbi:20581_t:CDS:2, partial [Entrophospora sp. SA101]